ncbi:hypothetical protein S83_049769 [Arachis hypogaea]
MKIKKKRSSVFITHALDFLLLHHHHQFSLFLRENKEEGKKKNKAKKKKEENPNGTSPFTLLPFSLFFLSLAGSGTKSVEYLEEYVGYESNFLLWRVPDITTKQFL